MDIKNLSDAVRPDHDENQGQPSDKQILQGRLKAAIEQDDLLELKEILAQDKQLVASTFRYQYDKDKPDIKAPILPLLYAAKLGRETIVETLLLEYNADINARLDGIGKTSLHLAATYGWFDTVRVLICCRVDVNQADIEGWTALHCASRGGHTKVARLLLENKASPELRNGKGQTALALACFRGDLELLQLLWDDGPKTAISDADIEGFQPSHNAACDNNHKVVTWLLEKNLDIEAKAFKGFTPLLQATLKSSYEAAEVLLDKGADVHARDTWNKSTPILVASYKRDLRILKLLHQYGASLLDCDKNGLSCFHYAINNKNSSQERFIELIVYLVGFGANINHLSRGDLSPLASACQLGRPAEVFFLLRFGADINRIASHSGTTALLEACSRPKNTAVINQLLMHKADTTQANRHGTCPLALACFLGHSEYVELLISRGCQIAPVDKLGQTPLHTAVVMGHFDIGLQLLKTPIYFPSNPDQWIPLDLPSKVADIGDKLVEELQKRSSIPLGDLHAIMYWAVANGHQALAEGCIKADEQILHMQRGGATFLYTAAQYAQPKMIPILSRASLSEVAMSQRTAIHWAAMRDMRETAEELFKLADTDYPIRAARSKVNLIMHRDGLGCTALATSIKYRGMALTTAPTDLFLDEIKNLGTVDKDFHSNHKAQAVEILEMLAEFEKPGHEETLRHLLVEWHQLQPSPETTTLEFAVQASEATVVWWLLSNGAYSSGRHITNALNSLPINRPSDVQRQIRELLEHPPPTLKRVPNPNDDKPPKLPDIRDTSSDSFDVNGMIVDIYADGRSAYTQSSIKKIIYDDGPNKVISREVRHPQQRFREFRDSLQLPRNRAPGSDKTLDHIAANQLFRWIHLPVAEMQLMRALANRISHDSNVSEMNHERMMQHLNLSWTELAAGGGKHYMKPRCMIKDPNQPPNGYNIGQEKHTKYMALYIPYLNFGPYQPDMSAHSHREDAQFESTYEPIQSRRSRQIIHKRLTLDQYFYSVLDETNGRDGDQVLSKFVDFWSKKKLVAKYDDDAPTATEGRQKTMVVDQLWAWVLDEKTIITATTEAHDKSGSLLLDNLKKNLLGNETESGFERPSSIYMFLEQILGITTGFFEWPVIHSKTPLDVFRESIRFVANTETDLFNNFRYALENEREKQDESLKQTGHAVKLMPPNPYHIITSETTLLDIIRDIRDELRILSSLADDQEDVWKPAIKTYSMNRTLQYYHVYTPSDVKEDLETLLGEAEIVYDSINLLLDLRQKQASIKEAEFGRIQANDSARQSNSIFIFTVITIIFLLLLSLSSLFALDISSFPYESGDLKYQGWWLFPILFGVTAIVSIPTIVLAWKINTISSWWNRKEAIVLAHQELSIARPKGFREVKLISSRFRQPKERINPV